MKASQSCPTLCDPMDCNPWNSPGQNTGAGSLSLLQGSFPNQGSNPGLLWKFPSGPVVRTLLSLPRAWVQSGDFSSCILLQAMQCSKNKQTKRLLGNKTLKPTLMPFSKGHHWRMGVGPPGALGCQDTGAPLPHLWSLSLAGGNE